MPKHRQILSIINELRNSHPCMEDIFKQGSCLNLFVILHTIYPEAKAWFNIEHIITEIDDRFYDITGQVDPKGYMRFTEFYNKEGTARSYKRMYDGHFNCIGVR